MKEIKEMKVLRLDGATVSYLLARYFGRYSQENVCQTWKLLTGLFQDLVLCPRGVGTLTGFGPNQGASEEIRQEPVLYLPIPGRILAGTDADPATEAIRLVSELHHRYPEIPAGGIGRNLFRMECVNISAKA